MEVVVVIVLVMGVAMLKIDSLSPVKRCQLDDFTPRILACSFKTFEVSCSGSIEIEAIPKFGFPKNLF